jgi:hypothetical protein
MAGNLMRMATGMIVDGAFATQAIDSSGEILDIDGCDISTLDKDGVLNYEHKEGDKKDAKGGNNGEEIVGKIVYAKKIMKESDCETERQKMFWEKVGRIPYIYGMCRLYDGAGHSGAQALAAQIRDHVANNELILVRFSIEGSTLERHGNRLSTSVARRVAATLKPCNRTAVSGLIEDPKAPEGFEKNPSKKESKVKDILAGLLDDHRDTEDAKKREHQHPMYTKLGGEFEVECSPLIKEEADLYKAMKLVVKARMLKALAAGSYNAAPSALIGGAALQREHLHGMKNRALAVLRDHGKSKFVKAEFKAILKAKLPEADDSFIDHFADLAEDYHVKLKKIEGLVKKEKTKEAPLKASKLPDVKTKLTKVPAQKAKAVKGPAYPAPPSDMPALNKPSPPLQLTLRGKPVKPSAYNKITFDEKTGTLHIPPIKAKWVKNNAKKGYEWKNGHTGGQFKMYIPGEYDPQIHASKGDAAKELKSFNDLMADPKVNEFHNYAMDNWSKVHALLKNKQLPPEVAMHATLFAQLSPNTPVPMQEYMYGHLVDSMKHTGIDARDPRFSQIKDDWLSRDTGEKEPDISPEHWKRVSGGIRLSHDSKSTGRKVGQLGGFMLANNKFDSMQDYHNVHSSLVDHINHHGADAQSAVRGLMENKLGQSQGPVVRGFAPKVARYTYGMLGGGNVTVPDTHFTRYLFGLEKGTAGKLDNRTIDTIKDALWNERNSKIMEGIDRHYMNRHPAVQHMVEHPRYGQMFQGEDRQHAVFPAFWKNWVAIVPHEQSRGYNTSGANEYTDHRPYWEAIDPFLKKTEDDFEHTLPMRTAMLHAEWARRYGEMPATLMYYRHLIPRLLAAHEARTSGTASVRKMEALTIELRKAVNEIKDSGDEGAEQHDVGSVHFAGHHVQPGAAKTLDGDFALLHEDKTHYVAIPKDKLSGWDPEHLQKFPKVKEGSHFQVLSRPSILVSDLE